MELTLKVKENTDWKVCKSMFGLYIFKKINHSNFFTNTITIRLRCNKFQKILN